MPNTHETLTSLFSDIADAIRAKTGDTADIVADDFPDAIAEISGGDGGAYDITATDNGDGTQTIDIVDASGRTPLVNPATADKIVLGYDAYGANGQVITGTISGGTGAVLKIFGLSHAESTFTLDGLFSSNASEYEEEA